MNTILNNLIGKTITGQKLNELLDGMPLVKFMYDDDKHYSIEYKTGLNHDILPFNNSGKCRKGGIYITTLADYDTHIDMYGNYARRVTVDPDALVYIEPYALKCNKVNLQDRIPKNELIEQLFNEYATDFKRIMNLVKLNGLALNKIESKDRTYEIILEAVRQNGLVLQFIELKDRTYEIMLEAVKQNGYALQFIDIKDRTYETMLEAVKQNGYAIECIESRQRRNEMILEAVKQNGLALFYIEQKEKTHEIMLEAVKQNGLALRYIKSNKMTEKIMEEAVKQNRGALRFIGFYDRDRIQYKVKK